MDKYQAYQIFAHVAEKLSFTKTAEDMRLPKATVSTTIQELEATLGAKLLNRTTRQVSLTPEGNIFLERCKQMLNDVEDAESIFKTNPAQLKGKVRIDSSVVVAKEIIIPNLPDFLKKYPEIEIELSSTDHRVDLIRDGIDCLIRNGGPTESGLVEKEIASLVSVNCVSPTYIKKYGRPKNLDDLKNHKIIHYSQNLGGKLHEFEYFDGTKCHYIKMKSIITVNSTISYLSACLTGLGIAQVPFSSARKFLEDGSLVEVLPKYKAEPFNLRLIYHERRLLSKRVRLFMEWLESIFKKHI